MATGGAEGKAGGSRASRSVFNTSTTDDAMDGNDGNRASYDIQRLWTKGEYSQEYLSQGITTSHYRSWRLPRQVPVPPERITKYPFSDKDFMQVPLFNTDTQFDGKLNIIGRFFMSSLLPR